MKTLLLVVLCACALVVVPAKADFDVFVKADGKSITIPELDTTLYFVNGIAALKVYTADGGGMFFALGKDFAARLKTDGYVVYGKPRESDIMTNVGEVYCVVAFKARGAKVAFVFPVEFNAFGVGMHGGEGERYHSGMVPFRTAESWLQNEVVREEHRW